MNKKNFDAWIEELRTTTKKQGQNVLKASYADEDARYCCLGIGCELAGIESNYPSDAGIIDFAGCTTLAPVEFAKWLGLDPELCGEETDLYPDWGDEIGDLYTRDTNDRLKWLSAASMNDSGQFTFAQIADVFAYFGIKEES